MSNALWALAEAQAQQQASAAPTTWPATQPAASAFMIGLLAVGIVALVVWVVRRLAFPGKLFLKGTPGRPNRLSPAHLVVLWLVWFAGMTGASLLPGSRLKLLAALLVQAVWLGSSVLVAGRTFRHGLRRGLGLSLRHWIYDTARGLAGYLAVIPICWGLYLLMTWLLPPDAQRMHHLLRLLPDLDWSWKVVVLVSAVAMAPLSEELFFRGLLQSMLRQYAGTPWLAIVLTSLAFALMHAPQWQDLPALFALSVALGYNYERCGRLLPAFLIHGLFNGVNIALFLAGGA